MNVEKTFLKTFLKNFEGEAFAVDFWDGEEVVFCLLYTSKALPKLERTQN